MLCDFELNKRWHRKPEDQHFLNRAIFSLRNRKDCKARRGHYQCTLYSKCGIRIQSGSAGFNPADRESERVLKETLLELHSCHFYGEESGGAITKQRDKAHAVKVYSVRPFYHLPKLQRDIDLFFCPSTKLTDIVVGVCMSEDREEKWLIMRAGIGAYIQKELLQSVQG
jgi:hypothetical protein